MLLIAFVLMLATVVTKVMSYFFSDTVTNYLLKQKNLMKTHHMIDYPLLSFLFICCRFVDHSLIIRKYYTRVREELKNLKL